MFLQLCFWFFDKRPDPWKDNNHDWALQSDLVSFYLEMAYKRYKDSGFDPSGARDL